MTVAIYLALFIAAVAYAALLERLHDLYTPDYIWVTVVVGNAMIGLSMLALCLTGAVGGELSAFWHLAGLNADAGSVIIAWQVWQATRRHLQRKDRQP